MVPEYNSIIDTSTHADQALPVSLELPVLLFFSDVFLSLSPGLPAPYNQPFGHKELEQKWV